MAKGDKLFMATTGSLFQYSLTTPYDLATASTTASIASQSSGNSAGFSWNNDGSKMYEGDTNGSIYQYSCSTPFDITTASLSSSILGGGSNVRGITWNIDGTRMYTAGNSTIYQYSMGTAFDITTASAIGSITAQEQGGDIKWNNDETKFVEAGDDSLYQYSVTTSGDVTTASLTDSVSVSVFLGFAWNNDGSKMYNGGIDATREYSCSTPFDITTASFTTTRTDADFFPIISIAWNFRPNQLVPKTIATPVTQLDESTPEPTIEPGSVSIQVPEIVLALTTPSPEFQRTLFAPVTQMDLTTPSPEFQRTIILNAPAGALTLTVPAPRVGADTWVLDGAPIPRIEDERFTYNDLTLVWISSRSDYQTHLAPIDDDSGKVEVNAISGGRFRSQDTSFTGMANTYTLTPPIDRINTAPSGNFLAKRFNSEIVGPRNNKRRTKIVWVPDQERSQGSGLLNESRQTKEWLFSFDSGAFSTRNIDTEWLQHASDKGIGSVRIRMPLEFDEIEVIAENVSLLAGDGVEDIEFRDGTSKLIDNTGGRNSVTITRPPDSEYSGTTQTDEILDSGTYVVSDWSAEWRGAYYSVEMEMTKQ